MPLIRCGAVAPISRFSCFLPPVARLPNTAPMFVISEAEATAIRAAFERAENWRPQTAFSGVDNPSAAAVRRLPIRL
jgi:hypothetical protein